MTKEDKSDFESWT